MTERKISRIVTTQLQLESSGFVVRKVIGGSIPSWDPVVMLDHIGPVTYKPGEAVGAPDHPHRGMDMLTYVINGGYKHQDSVGHKGVLRAGWVQWMTSGRGLIHSEMPSDEMMTEGGRSEGFQIWFNVPAKDKMLSPAYQDIPPDQVPTAPLPDNNVRVKVLVGDYCGAASTVRTKLPMMILDIHINPGSRLTVPVSEQYSSLIYTWRGSGFVGSDMQTVDMGDVCLLSQEGMDVQLQAGDDEPGCDFLLVAGQSINEPVVKCGPFIMNSQSEINQAIADYQEGRLGSIPGKEEREEQTRNALALQKRNGSFIEVPDMPDMT